MLYHTEPLTLLLGIIIVALASDSDPDLLGEVPNAVRPDELVQLRVDPHVGGLHQLRDQLPDL